MTEGKSARSYHRRRPAIDQSGIGNSSIIARIDHGKSMLADWILQLTDTPPIGPPGAAHEVSLVSAFNRWWNEGEG